MSTPQLTKRCPFNGCGIPIQEEAECCDDCCFKLHVEIRRLQGFTEAEAVEEWRREKGASLN